MTNKKLKNLLENKIKEFMDKINESEANLELTKQPQKKNQLEHTISFLVGKVEVLRVVADLLK
jgi:hypothetical protein